MGLVLLARPANAKWFDEALLPGVTVRRSEDNVDKDDRIIAEKHRLYKLRLLIHTCRQNQIWINCNNCCGCTTCTVWHLVASAAGVQCLCNDTAPLCCAVLLTCLLRAVEPIQTHPCMRTCQHRWICSSCLGRSRQQGNPSQDCQDLQHQCPCNAAAVEAPA